MAPSRTALRARLGLIVQISDVGSPAVRRLLTRLRSVAPKLAYMNVLFCGLPVFFIGQNNIGLSGDCDKFRFTQSLNSVMTDLARRYGARIMIIKEFNEAECGVLDLLLGFKFFRVATPNQYVMTRQHGSFFRATSDTLKSSYRKEINRSTNKFDQSGIEVEHHRGICVANRYTDYLHSLYQNVVDRAEHRLEVLPAEFFRSLAREFSR